MNAEQTVKDICELEEKKDVAFVDIRTKVLGVGTRQKVVPVAEVAEGRTENGEETRRRSANMEGLG